jgi:hypothetical protein
MYDEQFAFGADAWSWHIWKMAFHRGFERCRLELQNPEVSDTTGDAQRFEADIKELTKNSEVQKP